MMTTTKKATKKTVRTLSTGSTSNHVKQTSTRPHLPVYDEAGNRTSTVAVSQKLFGVKINTSVLAQAVRVYLANQRRGTAATKTRGEVRGSTRKIYRQKGTGRARHGSIRAPIFVGGGIVFGPSPRSYALKMSKNMKRVALASALTMKQEEKSIFVMDEKFFGNKTKNASKVLATLPKAKSILFVVGPESNMTGKAVRNIANVTVLPAFMLNPHAVVSHEQLIIMRAALPVLEKTFIASQNV